jgi:uncharacterized cupin superfamily protein
LVATRIDDAMIKRIINIADIALHPRPPAFAPTGIAAERFEARMGFISPHVGATKLGYNVTAVPPGKRAFPFHNHLVNKEMFFVLQGIGEIRIGENRFPIRPGDIIACPAGGPESAHQIINTGDDELRYLAISTTTSPEIAEYPDSGKFGVLADLPPGRDGEARRLAFIGRDGESLDYWEGA